MNWEPDLELELDGRQGVVARSPRRMARQSASAAEEEQPQVRKYHAPIFETNILPITGSLFDSVGEMFAANVKITTQSRVRTDIERAADDLFTELLDLNEGDDSLAEFIAGVLAEARDEGRTPEVSIIGDWYAVPWEFVRLPAEIVGAGEPRYFGEVAIIAAFPNRRTVKKGQEFVSDGPLQVVTWAGQNLSYLTGELAYVRALSGPHLHPPRITSGLPGTRNAMLAERSVKQLQREILQPNSAKFLHCACHSETPGGKDVFNLTLDRASNMTAPLLRSHKFKMAESNIGFFNTCHAFSSESWHGGGVARYALNRWRSVAVIASGCLLDDPGATDFAKALLGRVLPNSVPQGMALGRALFEARNELLTRARQPTLIGLCYRLIGSPELRISVGAPAEKQPRIAEVAGT